MSLESRVDGSPIRAQLFSIALGLKIQEDFPWVATVARSGTNYAQIAKSLSEYFPGVKSPEILRNGVRFAIRGYKGNLHAPYDGLIADRAECDSIAKRNHQMASMSKQAQANGIFARSQEKTLQDNKKGGLATKEKRVGIFGLSQKQRREASRLGKARQGTVLWMNDEEALAAGKPMAEVKYLVQLVESGKYTRPAHVRLGGTVEWHKVLADFNNGYHGGAPVRSRSSIIHAYATKNKYLLNSD